VLDAGRNSVIYGGSVRDVKDQREDSTAMARDQAIERLACSSRRDHRVASPNCRFCEGLPEPTRSTGDEPHARHFPIHLSMPRIIAGKRHAVKATSASDLSHVHALP
jgi:hypothetical protein